MSYDDVLSWVEPNREAYKKYETIDEFDSGFKSKMNNKLVSGDSRNAAVINIVEDYLAGKLDDKVMRKVNRKSEKGKTIAYTKHETVVDYITGVEINKFKDKVDKAQTLADLNKIDENKLSKTNRQKAIDIWNEKSKEIVNLNIQKTDKIISDIESQTDIDKLRDYPIDESVNPVAQRDAIRRRIRELEE